VLTTSAARAPEQSPAASLGGAPPAISIRGLTKSFGKRMRDREHALDRIDVDVHTGEFLVLLGASGCGKTTLLRTIAGLEKPDTGSIQIEDRVVFESESKVDVAAGSRPVTMIFQSYALWPHMTAARNVAFPLQCARVKRSEIPGRVAEILEKVGIGHLTDRYPGEMSGGQQQRLALARALVVGERIVLFDEPLSNVDAQVREQLRLELIRMQRTLGFTAIYVTHDQNEAMELADRIAVMDAGRIAQLDDPRTLYRSPRDVRVARFLGQSNEIPFTIEEVDGRSGRVAGTGPLGRVVAHWSAREGDQPPVVGTQIEAFGRPSDFKVVGADPSVTPSPDTNLWSGRIEATRYLGSAMEYVVQVGEHRLRCWVAPEEGPQGLDEGRAVSISIAAPMLRAIPER
jgi:iron(III) transport system ATP-binding protein